MEWLEARQMLTTLTLSGSANDNVSIQFTDATDFTVTINGAAPTAYSTTNIDKVVYNGPSGAASNVVFSDSITTDEYTAAQTFASTTLTRGGGISFEFDANNVTTLYVYVADTSSTATVNVAGGTGANYFVDAANAGYSYIVDPVQGIYSELSGFEGDTTGFSGDATGTIVTGTGDSTYAYVYLGSNGSAVGNPVTGTRVWVNTYSGFNDPTSVLTGIPQVYIVGAPTSPITA